MMKYIEVIKPKVKKLTESGAIHITLGTFATKFVAFFGSIAVVRLLSKDDYGLLSYVENIYSYAFIFAGFGLANAMLRYLITAKSLEEKKSYFSFIIKHSIIRNTIIACLLIVVGLCMPIPPNYNKARYLIPTIAILLPFQDLLSEDLYVVRSFFKNKLYAYLAFGSSTILIIGRIIGAYLCNVEGVLWSRIIINASFSMTCLFYIYKSFFKDVSFEKLSIEKSRVVNTYSLQYMITNGFWALFMLNDTFLLGQLLGSPTVLAEFKVAYAFPGNISIFATAIGVFIGPYFTKNEDNLDWIRVNYKKVFALSAVTVALVAIVIGLLAKPLILFMYGRNYLNVVDLMRVLLLAAFINSGLRYTTANLLAAMGEIRFNMIISAVGIAAQIVLDILLIPRFGAMGVAFGNCIVYSIMAVTLSMIFIRKYY